MKVQYYESWIKYTPEDYRDQLWIYKFYEHAVASEVHYNMEVEVQDPRRDEDRMGIPQKKYDLICLFELEEYKKYYTNNSEEERVDLDSFISDTIEYITEFTITNFPL